MKHLTDLKSKDGEAKGLLRNALVSRRQAQAVELLLSPLRCRTLHVLTSTVGSKVAQPPGLDLQNGQCAVARAIALVQALRQKLLEGEDVPIIESPSPDLSVARGCVVQHYNIALDLDRSSSILPDAISLEVGSGGFIPLIPSNAKYPTDRPIKLEGVELTVPRDNIPYLDIPLWRGEPPHPTAKLMSRLINFKQMSISIKRGDILDLQISIDGNRQLILEAWLRDKPNVRSDAISLEVSSENLTGIEKNFSRSPNPLKPLPIRVKPLPIRDQVFISYSHNDKKWLDELVNILSPVIREERIRIWEDTQIKAGEDWREQINIALATAKAAILLVTPNFLASDFISNNEIPYLLESANKKGLVIFWIAVRYSLYKETPIVKYQAVNNPLRPLESLPRADRNKEWLLIWEKIKQALNE